jgi:hypothetical protein
MEARVVLGVTVFVGLSLALVLTVTTRAVTSRSLERASGDLETARTAFARLVANRTEFASAQARLIAALPVFRAHMAMSGAADASARWRTTTPAAEGSVLHCHRRHRPWLRSGWPTGGNRPRRCRGDREKLES